MPFYYAYWGNKETELHEIMKYIDVKKYDTICECFGGSLAFSRHIYSISPEKKFLCSDVDADLVFFSNNFYKHKKQLVEDVKSKMKGFENDKQGFLDYINHKPNDEYERLKHHFFYNTMFKIRKGMMPPPERVCKFTKFEKQTESIDEFFKSNTYKLMDCTQALTSVKDDKNAFVFLDPPYFVNSDDNEYAENNIDHIWEYLIDFCLTAKCDYMLVVEKNVILTHIFKGYIIGEYDKTYKCYRGKNNKVKKTKHIIISNILQ